MNKFTVVIPTRERADTLYHTLRTCVNQDYENLSILVSDNCSTDNTEEVTRSFNDKRVQYVRTPQRLSMSANWDFALDHVDGGFVNFIGDDDGLIPGSLAITNQVLSETKVDAVTSKDMAIYFWPEYVEDAIKGNYLLSIKPTYRIMDTQKFFNKSFDICNCVHLPQLYHGYVNTNLVKDLKVKHGNFFNGSSPDIYAGVVLGKVLKKHVFSNYPLTIHGLSHHSIGSSNAFRHIDDNASKRFWVENNIPVHPKLEKSSSIAIIYADAFMLAKKYVPEIPDIKLENVLSLGLDEAAKENDAGRRSDLLGVLEQIAAKNNLSDYFRKIVDAIQLVNSQAVVTTYGFNPVNEMLTIKTTDIGLKNVYDAFLLSKNLLHNKVYAQYERPLNESLVDYFLRGFRGAMKKVFK
jgi:glycosyltransferase involved in cell wall biosynthesis